jgi:hypothetical protein
MGIARLTQDLANYAEHLTVGVSDASASYSFSVPQLWVIDGPSLVYHVYNKLLAYKLSQSVNVPTYAEINTGVHTFLKSLIDHGIEVYCDKQIARETG